mgnify:CR=1 FL=1
MQGLYGKDAATCVAELLQLVDLADVAGQGVGTFSGGMKRRLSVAMAAVGSPTVMLLDEPTTGLDPLSKARVHKMIESLKPGRIVILTTHAMAEANDLADTVALVANGRLRAAGTPLFLRTRYGKSFEIKVAVAAGLAARVKELAAAHIPGATFVAEAHHDDVNLFNATAPLGGTGGAGAAAAATVAGAPAAGCQRRAACCGRRCTHYGSGGGGAGLWRHHHCHPAHCCGRHPHFLARAARQRRHRHRQLCGVRPHAGAGVPAAGGAGHHRERRHWWRGR